jgi:bromodomain-containing factor 1
MTTFLSHDDSVERKTNDISLHDSALAAKPEPAPNVSDVSQTNAEPSDLKPIENVAPGLAPIADFLPKDRATSHPTPPPDDVPIASDLNSNDTEMPDQTDSATTAEPILTPKQTEPSLVRPREEEMDEIEPAAKRTKVGADADNDTPMSEPALADSITVARPPPMQDAPETESEAKSLSEAEPAAATEAKPTVEPTSMPVAPAPAPVAAEKPSYSKELMTTAQKGFLLEKMKNLKKTRNSHYFNKPVDPVALNIPQYLEIIKHPMDLSTMETKLKADNYGSVQDFADDFDLIITNTRRFNGDAHAVTTAGFSMEAYFHNMMRLVPNTNEPTTSKLSKKQSPAFQKAPAPRRESRVAAAPAPAASPSAVQDTFALQPDGTPQIRRDSSINRPSRAIKPPQNREIAYGKPKRKEYQPELKFCEMVLNQITSNKFQPQNNPFLVPVDPVALNIPNYHQVIKHPMDLSTMRQKLKVGEYAKASEFKKDFELIVTNCHLFNPPGNPVRQLGTQLQKDFDALWIGKDKFVQKRKAETLRATSASAEEDSAEEEEDDEDVTSASQADTIRALQKQLSDMQNALAGLNKPMKPKKTKTSSSAKPSSKKSSGSLSGSKIKSGSKPKLPKKPRQVTYDEKQEISSAVENLDGAQLDKLTSIITENCSKYAEMEEMELEIDDLPNNVQLMLLEYVRGIFGNPNRVRAVSPDDIAAMDDDDFEPERGARKSGADGKRKKHKPMGKKEQQDTIKQIQSQLEAFKQPGAGGGQSPALGGPGQSAADDSSEDDASEESEEE